MNRDFWKEVKKNIGLLQRLNPAYLPFAATYTLLRKAIPFAEIIFGARIVDLLVEKGSFRDVMIQAAFLVGTVFFLSLTAHIFEGFCGVEWMMVSVYKNTALSVKAMELDYDILEKNSTLELMAKAESGSDAMGGLADYAKNVVSAVGNVISVVFALATMGGLFQMSQVAGEGVLWEFFRSPLSMVCLLLLLGLSVYLGGRCQARTGKIRYEADMANVTSNRIYWFFYNLMFNYPAGKDIRIFHMRGLIEAQGENALSEMEKVKKDALSKELGIAFAGSAVQHVFMFGAWLFAGLKAILGMISIGGLTRYVNTILLLQGHINELSATIIQLKTQNTYLKSFGEYLDLKNQKYEGTLPVEKRQDNEYTLEFKNVSFRYPGNERMILKNVSFRFRVGGRLAIVGANGAGKTTFIKLLCRLYDPTEGEILLNGINIKKYSYEEYIRLFSVVFQDYKIFSFSVAENVSASPQFEEEKVIRSLKEAGLYERVSRMKDGIHTKLLKDQQEDGEEGLEISGGEKQKLALARALYRGAPIVILDEPTSALDPLAEQDIYERFNKMVEDKTAVFISHRMSSCRFCDNVIVFDDGRIVQTGTHEELLRDQEGLYSQMWNAQAQYYV